MAYYMFKPGLLPHKRCLGIFQWFPWIGWYWLDKWWMGGIMKTDTAFFRQIYWTNICGNGACLKGSLPWKTNLLWKATCIRGLIAGSKHRRKRPWLFLANLLVKYMITMTPISGDHCHERPTCYERPPILVDRKPVSRDHHHDRPPSSKRPPFLALEIYVLRLPYRHSWDTSQIHLIYNTRVLYT